MDTLEGDADVIVVGAGIHGIAFARFYLDVHPECRLLIVDRDSGPGGVWSQARNYLGFWSQAGLGMTEYSDRDLEVPPDARLLHNLPEARIITKYLEDYCDNHIYAGRTLRERIVFNCEVEKINKIDGVWHLDTMSLGKKKRFSAGKLVMASGLYSQPNLPDFPDRDIFQGKIIHQREVGRSNVLSDPNMKHVVILGGAKSAGDLAYACVKAGKSVSWVLRSSGGGPGAFSSPKGIGFYRNAPEIASTRLAGLLSPSMYGKGTWLEWICHQTTWGRAAMRWIYSKTDRETLELGDFKRSIGVKKGFEKLESNPDFFWMNGYVGMAQQPDFWDRIAESVDVYRSDLKGMTKDGIVLEDGSAIKADAILCGTGFETTFSLFQTPSAAELGLPIPFKDKQNNIADWESLEKVADQDIVRRFPGLANPPPSRKLPTSPYRLYNLMAPINDDSVVFLGYLGILAAFYTSECQAIWATAFFDKQLQVPSPEKRIEETAYLTAFSKRRYPFVGQEGNQLNYEMIGYCDALLEQVGLTSHLEIGWWQYWFGVCGATSLKGLKDEYLRKFPSPDRHST